MAHVDWEGRQADYENPTLIGSPDPTSHAQRRRLWNRALSSAALKEYEETLAKRVTDLYELLSTQKDVIDMNLWFGWFR